MLDTPQEKKNALKTFDIRREKNKDIKRVNNASLYVGSPMYFYCITCGEEMLEPEGYISRSTICSECRVLKELDWLE